MDENKIVNVELSKEELTDIVCGLTTQIRMTDETMKSTIAIRDNKLGTDEMTSTVNEIIVGLEKRRNDLVTLVNKLRPLYLDEWQIRRYPIA